MNMLNKEKQNCKDIYDYALLIEKENMLNYPIKNISDDKLLINSLIRIMENEERNYAIKILGINPYLECLKYSNEFSKKDIEESYYVFDEVYPKYKNYKESKKIEFLEEVINKKYMDIEKIFSYFISKTRNFSVENIEIARQYDLNKDYHGEKY